MSEEYEHRDPTEFEKRLVADAISLGVQMFADRLARDVAPAHTVRADWLAGRLEHPSVTSRDGDARRLVNGVEMHFWREEPCANCEHLREWHRSYDEVVPKLGPCGARDCNCEEFAESLVGDLPAH